MKKVFVILVAVVLIASCDNSQEENPYEWSKDNVGSITRETMVYQLDSLFVNDSIVNPMQGDEFGNGPGSIEIYEKNGKHLFSITPKEALDSTSTIDYIMIRDNRYTTAEGISLNSTFKEIDQAYKVTSVDNIIDDAMVRVDNQNFYFTISKETFPAEVRYDMDKAIEKTMVPDEVKPETIFVSW